MSDVKVNPATVEFLKQEQAKRRKRRAIASALGLVMVASISTAGYFGWQKYRANQQLARAQQLVSTVTPNREGFQKVREAVENGEITRQQAWAAFEEAREKQEQAVMDGYFKTAAKDRQAYLDKLIDEQIKRREEWMRNRPTSQPTTRPDRGERREGPASRPSEAEREARGRARVDNQSPVQRAQQGEFRAAMRARLQARGIQMGRGGFGGGGRGRGDR